MIRRQLPTYSPLGLRSWARACVDSIREPQGARNRLTSLLAQLYPCESVVLTGSGTQALELAIRIGLGARRAGASVGLPAYSCFDVLTAAVGAGAPVLFYDLDPETLTPDKDSLRGVLARGAGVVVVASLYGFPVDWDAVGGYCADTGAVLIEDAAQGLGSTWRGREGGNFGELTILSFGRGKGWTGGGGGALLLRLGSEGARGEMVQEGPVTQVLPSRVGTGAQAAAVTLAQWGFGRPSLYRIPYGLPWLHLGETAYKDPVPVRAISAFSAALAAAMSEMSAAEVDGRRKRAATLRDLLGSEGAPMQLRPVVPLAEGESAYLRFPLLGSAGARASFESRAARSLGILRGYPRSLPELPAANGIQQERPGRFPGAEELSRNLYTLPTHSLLTQRDMAKMARLLRCHVRSGL